MAWANQVKGSNVDRSRTLTTYEAGASAAIGEQSSVSLHHGKDFAYKDQILTNANGQILHAETTRADINSRPAERIRLEGDTTYRKAE
ncbi:MAG: hypothetical protein R3E89_10865 [Thiolinea sp.]